MNATISPKDRIMDAYSHTDTDRVAVFFKNDEPSITRELMDILQVKTRDEMLSKLGIDLRIKYVSYAGPPLSSEYNRDVQRNWQLHCNGNRLSCAFAICMIMYAATKQHKLKITQMAIEEISDHLYSDF